MTAASTTSILVEPDCGEAEMSVPRALRDVTETGVESLGTDDRASYQALLGEFKMIRMKSACVTAIFLNAMSGIPAFSAPDPVGTSPFGNATPAQQQAAENAERGRLNALREWERLPQSQRDKIAAQLAPLTNEQSLALLSSVPSLSKLSRAEQQVLLDEIVEDVPLPARSNLLGCFCRPAPGTTNLPLTRIDTCVANYAGVTLTSGCQQACESAGLIFINSVFINTDYQNHPSCVGQ